MDYERPPNGEAQMLLDNALLQQIFTEMEASAIETCVNAPNSDDETRREAALEARVIRSLKQKLITLAEGKAKLPRRGAVA